MIDNIIKGVLLIAIVVLAYFVFESIAGKIRFDEEAKRRRNVTIERLKDIRAAQLAYKEVKKEFANTFDALLNFITHDSLPVIKAIGTVPDTLTEEDAVKMGIVRRDTIMVSARDSIFSPTYLKNRITKFYLDSLPYIPYSGGKQFTIQAGEIERGKVRVKVFEVFGAFMDIYSGLDFSNEDIDSDTGLKVGSMTEPSVAGNWGE
ncbi:MAG: hypothetical protein HYY40_06195 [Bacteroidetes bacterium]|nr:hypothetical protein [Bacteroidota bacterium]